VTTDHFSSRAPDASRTSAASGGTFYFAWGCFRDFVSGLPGAPPRSASKTRVNALTSVSKARVNALMRRCAASGTRDRYCFALTANRSNSNASCSRAVGLECRVIFPHPCVTAPPLSLEERRLRRVSKDGCCSPSWFETAQERLLTMRSESHHPGRRATPRVVTRRHQSARCSGH